MSSCCRCHIHKYRSAGSAYLFLRVTACCRYCIEIVRFYMMSLLFRLLVLDCVTLGIVYIDYLVFGMVLVDLRLQLVFLKITKLFPGYIR